MTSKNANSDQVIDGIMKRASEQDLPRNTENRDTDRHPYHGHIVLILLDHSSSPCSPLLLKAEDISRGGLGVVSRHMFHVGAVGAVEMLRSDGKTVIIGVKVRHCRYAGEMKHHSGFEFIPLPHQIKDSLFMCEDGRKHLIHQMMAEKKAA